MSDKTYWINKNVKRQLAKSNFFAFENGGTKTWMTTVLMIGVIVAVFGIFQYFMQKQTWGLIAAIGGAIASIFVLIVYLVSSKNRFTEYVYKFEGKELIFQYIGKNTMYFECDGVVIEFKDRKAQRVDERFKAYRAYDKALEVVYTDKTKKGQSIFWLGESTDIIDGVEQKVSYKIKVESLKNKFEAYYVNGQEMAVYLLKEGEHKLNMPLPMYNAIKAEGIALPDDKIITLLYKY